MKINYDDLTLEEISIVQFFNTIPLSNVSFVGIYAKENNEGYMISFKARNRNLHFYLNAKKVVTCVQMKIGEIITPCAFISHKKDLNAFILDYWQRYIEHFTLKIRLLLV